MDQKRMKLRSGDRRAKRSGDRAEALQYLVEAVADRSGAQALVLVDDAGRIVAGMGSPSEVTGLAGTARDVARQRATLEQIEWATRGADVTARGLPTCEGPLYLAALGDRMKGVGDAVRAVRRILGETASS